MPRALPHFSFPGFLYFRRRRRIYCKIPTRPRCSFATFSLQLFTQLTSSPFDTRSFAMIHHRFVGHRRPSPSVCGGGGRVYLFVVNEAVLQTTPYPTSLLSHCPAGCLFLCFIVHSVQIPCDGPSTTRRNSHSPATTATTTTSTTHGKAAAFFCILILVFNSENYGFHQGNLARR